MLPTSETLIPLIQTSYGLLFLLAVVEGPLVTMIAGAACAAGFLSFPLAYLIVASGDLTADTLYYSLGRWGREKLILRYGKYIGLTVEGVEKLEERFKDHGGRLLFIGKISHGIGAAFLVAAGLARMPFRKYFPLNIAATLPKSLLFLLIGYYFGQGITKASNALGYVTLAIVGSAVLGVSVYLISRRARKQAV